MTRIFQIVAAVALVFGAVAAQSQQADTDDTQQVEAGESQQDGSTEITANQPVPVDETQHGDWTVVCFLLEGQSRICNMQQTIFNSAGVSVARMSVRAQDDLFIAAIAEIITPLGTDLARGIGLRIDNGAARSVPFQVCFVEGCVGIIEMTHEQVDQLRRGNKIAMSIQEFGQQNPVALEVSLTGFTKGFAALTE